jgi:integrase
MAQKHRGMGSVFLRSRKQDGSGGVFWISYYQNGRRFYESAGAGKTKAQATELLRRRLADLQTGEHITAKDRRVMIASLWQDFINEKTMRKQDTINPCIRWKKRLCPVFGHLRAAQLTTDMLKKYVRDRQKAGTADATINRDMADLKRAFNLGYRSTPRKVAQVPIFPMLKEDNVRTGFIDDTQYDELVKHAPDLWLRTLLALAYNFGWRRSELLYLRVSQVDILEKTIRIWRGKSRSKSGEPRLVPFAGLDDVTALLTECVRGKGSNDFVLTRDDVPVRDFRKAWRAATKAAGLGEQIFHDLRRSAVRNMIRRGIPQKVAMLISGHKTASVFDRYNIVDDADLRDATQKMRRENSDRTVTISGKSQSLAAKVN